MRRDAADWEAGVVWPLRRAVRARAERGDDSPEPPNDEGDSAVLMLLTINEEDRNDSDGEEDGSG